MKNWEFTLIIHCPRPLRLKIPLKNVTLYCICSAESNVTFLYQSENCFVMLTYCHILSTAVQYGVILLDSIIKFQKRAAMCILDKDIETPSAEMFAELKWMKFPDRVQYQKAVMMYNFFHNLSQSYLQELFQHTSEIHGRTLRSTNEILLYVPKPNIEQFKNSLSYSGSKNWNSIPENIN